MLDYRTGVGASIIFLSLGTAAGAQPLSNPQNLPAGTQLPTGCAPVQAPVCGILADKETYSNECEARRAGAMILGTGECRNKPSKD